MESNDHIVREGVYIHPTDTVWPARPDEAVLQVKKLREVKVDENYPFLDRTFKGWFFRNLIYTIVFTLVFLLQHLRYGLKIEGRENIRRNKKLFKNGALTVCNHVYRWDFLAVVQATRKREWFPARAENLGGSDQILIRSVGGIPIAENFAGMKKFYAAFDELHSKKKWFHVFPEASRWQWYQPLRPFKRGAFEFAHRYDIPVIPMVITYREPKGLRKLIGIKHPLLTLRVGEPFLSDQTISSKQDSIRMRKIAFEKMCEMAGIVKNKWPCEGD